MQYVNIKLSVLKSPEFIQAEPVQRATWLSLLSYCCDQENSGVIKDCRLWKDRTWQQVCSVTASEVQQECDLFWFQGDDLFIFEYPVSAEVAVKQKREGGRAGGLKSAQTRKKGSIPSSIDEADLEAQLERKEKERKEMERKLKEEKEIKNNPNETSPETKTESVRALTSDRLQDHYTPESQETETPVIFPVATPVHIKSGAEHFLRLKGDKPKMDGMYIQIRSRFQKANKTDLDAILPGILEGLSARFDSINENGGDYKHYLSSLSRMISDMKTLPELPRVENPKVLPKGIYKKLTD
jgi:hypothetical protein